MELILKPTSACNFSCTYCSAKNMQLQTLTTVIEPLKNLLSTLKPSTIILTGGDPLCVDPKFYFELLELGDWNISFTTNLKDFILNPEKWLKLFQNPRVGVCTSFQYGENRKYSDTVIYTEQMFIDTMTAFKQKIGYTPGFISVIDSTNEHTLFKHLDLAKMLGTKCKINRMMPLGCATEQYPLYKLIQNYLDICNSDYAQYLDITTVLTSGGCGFNINGLCQSTIRAAMFNCSGELQYATCEDDLVLGDFIPVDDCCPLPSRAKLSIADHLTPQCMFCELFYLCHGCKHNRRLNRLVKNHCKEMQKMKSQILNMNWKLQP